MSVRDFRLKGRCAAPLTPFKENGELDLDKIPAYIDHLLEFKATSLFITGTISEGNSMTLDERKQVMKCWMAHAKDKFQIMAQVGTGNLRDSQELARYAEEIGIHVISCASPTYHKPGSEEEYVEYMKHVAAAAPNTPFYLYDNDRVTGLTLNVPKFFELAKGRIPTLVGVKHTTPSLASMNRVLMQDGGNRFQVLLGGDELYLAALALGIDTPVVASYTCPTLLRIQEAFDKGDYKMARMEQNRLLLASGIRRKYLSYGLAAITKAMLKTMGLDLGPPRLPMKQISDETYEVIKGELSDIGFYDWMNL